MAAPDRRSRDPRRCARARATRLFAGPGASLVTWSWSRRWRGPAGTCSSGPWSAPSRARLRRLQGGAGACWGFVAEKWRLILFGRYPYEQQWRPALATARRGGDAGRQRAAGALVAARRARARVGWVDRVRRVLHADVRRRVRPRAGRHRALGRPATDGHPDADRHGRLGADRHRAGAGTALVARAAALARDRLHRARARRAA